MATESYTKAQFWRCALQVNPASYIRYRGQTHGVAGEELGAGEITEEQYNRQLLEIALEQGIKVIGLADHGNVDAVDTIRELFGQHGIVVFPGFEIASTEKAHFVCLFPEGTSKDQLNRYLGALGLTNPENGVWPSNFGGHDLLQKIESLGGFAYAAHCTDDNGVLYRNLVHVWQDPLLKAVQIPGTLDDLKSESGMGFRQILRNKNPDYRREVPVGIINARDVATPADLANPKASCLIKMTKPCFESFKLAFQDPGSRVRLLTDRSEPYFSRIEKLKVTGGYLDGIEINFSEHLNAIIGGRGTGKSTLLESLRFALDIPPIGLVARKQHHEIIKENLGKSKARVELIVRSSRMNGRKFTIARRYGESPSVMDQDGKPSSFSPNELLPGIEIYGQNEIYEIAQNAGSQAALLSRFIDDSQSLADEGRKLEALRKLTDNRKKLLEARKAVADLEEEVARIPKLEEQIKQFQKLGIEEKLTIIPFLETEKRLARRAVEEDLAGLNKAFQVVEENLPDTVFLSDIALANLPHRKDLAVIRGELDNVKAQTAGLLRQWGDAYRVANQNISDAVERIKKGIQDEEESLEKTFKDLPASEGKTGRQIGNEFQELLKEIERIRPKETTIKTRRALLDELQEQRTVLLNELSAVRADRAARMERALKSLNRKLKGKMNLTVTPEADRQPVVDFLLTCDLENIGAGRLKWIYEAEDFSPVQLAQKIRTGASTLSAAEWKITPTVAEALARLSPARILELEEIELPDQVKIELNTSHEGADNFRPLDKLSTGQQCTAILHLLLLQNQDPLIMDQPEDNLDNAFIADRIVAELRSAKIERQFIFATHNANIPVFGDAEWIGVLSVVDNQARMPKEAQGAIDVPHVKEKAAEILEGGRAAFNQRKCKYGF